MIAGAVAAAVAVPRVVLPAPSLPKWIGHR
jgi:hypothetical protein